MERINKLKEIAMEAGVTANIKQVGGIIMASVNGVSFKVQGFATFAAKCNELKGYKKPEPIELTSRLAKIEELALQDI
jgi:hypothetical protein